MTLQAAQIVLRPVISEKSMDETQRGKYTFRVHSGANKFQIAAAVHELFKVDVVGVNVLTTHPHAKRRFSRSRAKGMTTPWRKAIVTIAAGQKIEFFEGV
ncbi:MAG TPA: 50S ribosomal protein L23 [Candidatus Dormibacteraeota bacterium]|nr:50S ribosomal protein L23 [Candidatus Dormibacteraeota bacterium]